MVSAYHALQDLAPHVIAHKPPAPVAKSDTIFLIIAVHNVVQTAKHVMAAQQTVLLAMIRTI